MQNNTRTLISFLGFMALLAGITYFGAQYYQNNLAERPESEIIESLGEITPTPRPFKEEIREASESSKAATIHFTKPTGGDYMPTADQLPTPTPVK